MTHAPVLLIAFNRPEHTQKTLDALMLQHPQEVYVFQDGARPNHDGDRVNCPLVHQVVEEFVQNNHECIFHTYYSDQNRGCRDAIIFAISSVLKEHESVIVVEDDIITSPAFLTYMNKALEYYRDHKSVFSISGHSHASSRFNIPADYPYDVYASPRLFNWGWATWRDRWERADWSMSYYEELMNNLSMQEAFCRGGDDMLRMLIDEKEGRSSAWDIQFAFAHFKNHAVSIVPCMSYTHNIGEDGSGTHCLCTKEASSFVPASLNEKTDVKFLDTLYFDKRIINQQYNLFSRRKRPLWQKAINWLARLIGAEAPYKIKARVFAEK